MYYVVWKDKFHTKVDYRYDIPVFIANDYSLNLFNLKIYNILLN